MKWGITTSFIVLFTQSVVAQYCEESPFPPTDLYVTDLSFNQTNATANFNWIVADSAYRYIINRKKLMDTEWEPVGAIDTIFSFETDRVFGGMDYLTTYVWRMKSFCGTGTQPQSDWSVIDTFSTLEFTPASYSPALEITLGHTDCEKPAELTFTVEQDANEPDIQSSAIFSSAGSFAIYSLEEADVIGEAYIMAGGGFYENDYTLTVDEVISTDETIVAMENEETGVTDGYFTIENESNGIKIVNVSPNDGNSYTSGNYSEITFYDLFMNPGPGVLEFYATIPSELSDLYDDQIDFTIGCVAIEEFLLPTIYPNPTDGVLNIDLEGKKNISLMHVTGQKVLELKTSSRQIDVSSLASGVYFLEVQIGIHLFRNKLILR